MSFLLLSVKVNPKMADKVAIFCDMVVKIDFAPHPFLIFFFWSTDQVHDAVAFDSDFRLSLFTSWKINIVAKLLKCMK